MFYSEKIANASVDTEHTNRMTTMTMLSVQVVVTAKSNFHPLPCPPLSKTIVTHIRELMNLHSPPLLSSASNSNSLPQGGCDSAGHSCPFIKQRMAQSPLATRFLQVELKDVNFSRGILNSFRVCYLKTVFWWYYYSFLYSIRTVS